MKKLRFVFYGVFVLILIALISVWYSSRKPIVSGVPPPSQVLVTKLETEHTHTECPNTFMSWNIANFGRRRTDEEIAFMASILAPADIVAIQEVTAGKHFGAQAIGKLADALSRTGSAWDCIVSDPTMPPSSGVERYAFCSKKKSVHFDRHKAHLVKELEAKIDREPYTLFFEPKYGKPLDVFTIHAVPTAKAPIKEIRALTFSSALGDTPRAIVAGDFNIPPKETDPLFAAVGYQGHIAELTSLRKKVTGAQYLSRQYDNIYTKGVEVCTSGAVDFVKKSFSPVNDESLLRALKISDHLPVFVTFK